ncbi:MAG: DEAD/DEAH box helicase, partial [Brachybacterium alimentarium]
GRGGQGSGEQGQRSGGGRRGGQGGGRREAAPARYSTSSEGSRGGDSVSGLAAFSSGRSR